MYDRVSGVRAIGMRKRRGRRKCRAARATMAMAIVRAKARGRTRTRRRRGRQRVTARQHYSRLRDLQRPHHPRREALRGITPRHRREP